MTHVFDGKSFAGILHAADLLMALASGRISPNEPAMHIMKSTLLEVSADATLAELELVFRTEKIVRVREANVALTAADLADYLSRHEQQGS